MLERFELETAKPLEVGFTQMYDYAKLSFSLGIPYDVLFEIDLSENDIDLIIEKLKKLKTELIKSKEKMV